jgi:hypothetical protein
MCSILSALCIRELYIAVFKCFYHMPTMHVVSVSTSGPRGSLKTFLKVSISLITWSILCHGLGLVSPRLISATSQSCPAASRQQVTIFYAHRSCTAKAL